MSHTHQSDDHLDASFTFLPALPAPAGISLPQPADPIFLVPDQTDWQDFIDIPDVTEGEDGAATPFTELALEEDAVDEDNDDLVALGLRRVPQRRYVATHQAPRDFLQMTYTWGGVIGIPLEAVISGRLENLDNAGERDTFGDFKKKVHYRLEWPGYKSFRYAKNVRGKDGPITRVVVVQQITEMVKVFIDENAPQASDDPAWRVGPGAIRVEDLLLIGLDFVSQGSVQPQLAVRAANDQP
ncbi:hypothetical protein NM688_g834 [Phlebia brevispora]|uniref:Uncharacterized protein n=1 Tax=Phlebia brevispora TaxID=194682 RepID=A0ACC1TDK5_9APHY|nr:hypothetical protein NM688_g834 [Phlebia brevispora]